MVLISLRLYLQLCKPADTGGDFFLTQESVSYVGKEMHSSLSGVNTVWVGIVEDEVTLFLRTLQYGKVLDGQ